MKKQLLTLEIEGELDDTDFDILRNQLKDVEVIALSDKNIDSYYSTMKLYEEHKIKLSERWYIEKSVNNQINKYIENKVFPLMSMLGNEGVEQMDILLRAYYALDDTCRDFFMDILRAATKNYSDPARIEQVEGLKKW